MTEHTFTYNQPFELEGGGVLPRIDICYHTSADSVQGRPVVWICHALTANSNPEEWWDTLVGEGKHFDTGKYFIVCANMLGSCYGSTGPQSINPLTGKPYLRDFPIISIRDMVRAHELLRRHLGITRIDLVTGGSSGGFQALEWSISNPSLIRRLCLIASGARVSPWATALNETQRMALEADPTFTSGQDLHGGLSGLAAARACALLSYRSYEGYAQTQAESDPDTFLARKACTYQQHQGQKLVDRFNAYSYYTLTQSLDTYNVGRQRGGVEAALQRITARSLCIGIDSDLLFPLSELEFAAAHIPHSRLAVISSAFGHDGFLLEYKQIASQLCKYLNLEEAL